MSSWYNEERVGVKGSVILAKWNAGRDAARKRPSRVEGQRMYAAAAYNRLTSDWSALNTSADSEIVTSLRLLRARSREMVRDNAHAKNAVRIVQNNVVGVGIGFQSQVVNARGKLNAPVNDQIEKAWSAWCEKKTCHTAGLLGLPDMLRVAMGQIVEAGEVILRKVRQPFGGGTIPFALEVIEADRLMDQFQTAQAPNGNAIRMGVEVDQWGRPVAYWFYPTHPGDYQFRSFEASKFLRIPADEIIHLYIIDRWPQTRGVPWFHSVLKRINDMKGYSEAEIVAARASANIVGFIKSEAGVMPDDTQNGQRIIDAEPGTFKQLLPGEDFTGFNPSRPNAALEPFMRYMLREMAAGVGTSYESLSRDYSQSNYSSSRLALLDDRDLWRVIQGWLIRNCLVDIQREWLAAAVLAGKVTALDYFSSPEKYQRSRWKPRGWSWIDPTKEVSAYRMAVRAGFMTVADVISQTNGGSDAEDVFKARRQELDMMEDHDLTFDTDPAKVDITGKVLVAAIGEPESPDDVEPDATGITGDEDESAADSGDSDES
jgi:lambda family phage portal protein